MDGAEKLKNEVIPRLQRDLTESIEVDDWNDSIEICYNLIVNLCSLETLRQMDVKP